MKTSMGRRLAACSPLIAWIFAATTAVGQGAPENTTESLVEEGACSEAEPAAALTLDQLAQMSWPELERIYRQADAGTLPDGYTAGKAIYCPCDRHAAMRSRLTGFVWRGKVFDAADGSLVNQWCGFRAIRARVTYGPSRLDGKPSILMDYGETSRVWADVRDEAREVAPGLYLGRMYRCKAGGPEFQMYFALQAGPR